MSKRAIKIFILFLPLVSFGKDSEFVQHPQPKEPIYLQSSLYDKLKVNLNAPPALQSNEQKNDEKELIRLQKMRKVSDCNAAADEVFVSLKSFYGNASGVIDQKDLIRLSAFFDQVRNDADYFIQRLKKDYPRKRPFVYLGHIKPCVPKETTGSFPSGHATLSKLFSSILADIYPQHSKHLESRADEIGQHRVTSGMHHPTDIEAGKLLAHLIYAELKKSEKFKEDFKIATEKLNRKP